MDFTVDRDTVWPAPCQGTHSQSAVGFQSPSHLHSTSLHPSPLHSASPHPSHLHSASLHPSPLHSASLHPSPLHSASIHITEFSDVANPQPRGAGQGEGNPGRDYLSPSKLRELTGQPDLSQVTYLELSVNTSENSLGNFGVHLPRLSQLRVEEGVVPCVRDLGTSLSSVSVLWMPCCRVHDLDGLAALSSLQELYLPFNEIADVSLVAMLSSLGVLDLEGNEVSDLDQLGYLGLCPALSSLTLEGNPLTTTLAQEGGEESYRSAVREAIPHLRILDDTPLTSSGGIHRQSKEAPPTSGDPTHSLKSESSLFRLSEVGMGEDAQVVMEGLRKGWGRGEGEGSPLAPRPSSARPKTAPIQALQHTMPHLPILPTAADDSSDLTHGLSQVICGNPVRALKARKRQGLVSRSAVLGAPPSSPPPTAQALLSELQGWRLSSTPHLMAVMEGGTDVTERGGDGVIGGGGDGVTGGGGAGVTGGGGDGVTGGGGARRQASLSETMEDEGITITKAKSQENLLDDPSPSHAHKRQPSPSHTHKRQPSPSHAHKRQPAHFSPTPPPGNPPPHSRRLPTPPPGNPPPHPRRLPTPPSHTPSSQPPPRPKSVADFRHRRYRRPSEGSPGRSRSAHTHPSPPPTQRLLSPPSQTATI